MNTKSVAMMAIALVLTACGNSNEKAVGLYKYDVSLTGTEKIAEVRKEGSAYIFVEDVIRKSNGIALTETADGLSYSNMALKLSEDGNTLYFGPINGTRVDRSYLTERLETIENNKRLCAELKEEVEANKENMPRAQWREYADSFKGRTPPDCHISTWHW